MIKFATAALFGASMFVAGAASALVVEPFNGTGNLPDPFVSQGFSYSPTYDNSGQCFNSRCLQDNNGQDGLATVQTIATGASFTSYDFLGLYINMNGFGGNPNTTATLTNFLSILGSDNATLTLQVDTDISSIVDIWKDDGTAVTDGKLTQDSQGYFIIFKNNPFNDVSSMTFTALNSATLRMDCMLMNTGATNATGLGFASFNGCVPSTEPPINNPPIPLPASAWLLVGAFGGIAALRRKKRA